MILNNPSLSRTIGEGLDLVQPLHYIPLMGTLKRFGRIRVVMLVGDHAPPHVHILGQAGEVVVRLDNMEMLGTPTAIRDAVDPMAWIRSNLKNLLSSWQEVNG